MSIKTVVKSAYEKYHKRNWDSIYYLVDLHDTVFESTYDSNSIVIIQEAKKYLQKLSQFPETKIILWSSVTLEDKLKYIDIFDNLNLSIFAFNINPDYTTAEGSGGIYADFSEKPYFSVIVDDKAGFERSDWKKLYKAVKKYR